MSENASQVISRIRALHQDVIARLSEVRERVGPGRQQLVMDYIARHEEQMDDALGQYESSASAGLLASGFKSAPGKPLEDCINLLKFDGSDSDTLLDSVLSMNRCLCETLRFMAERGGNAEVREFFLQLVGMLERENQRLVRDAIEMEDL